MDSRYPKISIVTPSYNQGQFLEETILSIINQDYPNLEYIIVDGASTDNTPDILERYAHHPRITRMISEKDKGQIDALIKGFSLCTGDILDWINSDDLLEPGALSIVAQHFRANPEIDVLVGHQFVIDENGKQYGISRRVKVTREDWLKRHPGIQQPCTFFTASAYKAVGGLNPDLEYSMDYDIFLKFAVGGFKFAYIEPVLARTRYHDSAKSITLPYKLFLQQFKVFHAAGGKIISPYSLNYLRGILCWFFKYKVVRIKSRNKMLYNKCYK